jgi:hypothetical protein
MRWMAQQHIMCGAPHLHTTLPHTRLQANMARGRYFKTYVKDIHRAMCYL